MTVLIRIAAAMKPSHEALVGWWLKSFDPEAFDGRGDALFTDRPDLALRFETLGEAFELWRRQSRCRPLREDGEPNRPLTAFSVTFDAELSK
jgi:hypothetical protein